MKLTIAIPAYNEEAYLPECLACILRCIEGRTNRQEIELLVVDNGSTDRTAAVVRNFPAFRLVREPRKGLTRARQRALQEARGDILAFVDADTHMPAGWIDRMMEPFCTNSRTVCVSGPYRYFDLPPMKQGLVKLYWLLAAQPVYACTRYMAVGGNFAARTEALRFIGGFDTSIAFYGEDTNIARRLKVCGDVVFDMQLVMETSGRRLAAEGFVRTAVRYAANFLSEAVLKRPVTTGYRDIR